ncbi:MAG: glycosyltransferase family 2 protein [Nitrososphaerales archaeon]
MIQESGKTIFSIGICATDLANNLPALLDVVTKEPLGPNFELRRIIIVASECSSRALSFVKSVASKDRRIVLIEEWERQGKSDAINKIIGNHVGEFVVFINSDALPERLAITKLISAIVSDGRVGVISARPVFDHLREDATTKVEELMWNVHNESSMLLNHLEMSNHSSDEMMVVRSEALHLLPFGLVNDGAYLAGKAKLKGYLIKFCDDARVRIDVPARLAQLIGQRRRILYGHIQVWRLTGSSPKTIESLLFTSPALSFGIPVKMLSRSPRLIPIMPLAIFVEAVSGMLAAWDTLSKRNKHRVWQRYGN